MERYENIIFILQVNFVCLKFVVCGLIAKYTLIVPIWSTFFANHQE